MTSTSSAKKILKTFSVTLYPNPVTYEIMAESGLQAIGVAVHNYGSGDVTGYGFQSYHVQEEPPK